MSFRFSVVIAILCLLLVGCGNLRSVSEEVNDEEVVSNAEITYGELEVVSDYLLEKESIGKGVFLSEHLSEAEEFIRLLLMEMIENRGNIPEDKKQYFSDWAMEQVNQTDWGTQKTEWIVNSYTYERSYTLNYLYGNVGYKFFYTFYLDTEKSTSDKMNLVNVQALIDSNGIIRGINIEIIIASEIEETVVDRDNISILYHDEFQELIIEEGLVYEGNIVYEQNGYGLLASGDAALSAETIGEVLINVLENGGTETEDCKDLFGCESSFQMFKEQKWNQLEAGWKANSYYDCYYNYIYQKDGYIEFLYYFYPDYDAMDVETAKALTFRCAVDIEDGKLSNTDLMICSMTKEEYKAAREWKGRRIAIIKDGEIAGGGGNIPIPIPEDSKEKINVDTREPGYIDTNSDMGEYSLCELLIEDLNSGNIEDKRISEFITDKEAGWLTDITEAVRENIDAGWQMGEKYDFYYLNHNEQAERIHYRYYFYWNKADEEMEKVLVTDAWMSEEGLEKMEIHWFMSRRHFINNMSKESEEEILKEADIAAFLAFDWTTEQVLMGDHSIEPEDSAQGWEFSIADIDFDGKQEMLISFPSNHCGGNSLYIYRQENGNILSHADTIATPVRCMITGIDYKEISPYMDIDLIDAYVNAENEYRYLSLDCSSFGGDIHGGIYTVILYETVFDNKEKPKEIVRIDYSASEEKEELYFEEEKIYEMGKLRDLIALYMDNYTEVKISYRTVEKTFARDVVAISDKEKKQELEELYKSMEKLITG